MSSKQLKFVIGPVIVVLVLVWIGTSAFNSNMSYFQTVSELYAMEANNTIEGKRLKVMGEVIPGTIERTADAVEFTIVDLDTRETLDVRYVGTAPLPDTLRDYAEAVVDGDYSGDGVFTATTLQAKCASKYERELEAGIVPETTELMPEGGR
jgi:cytochrome c-type biogenesis protein CcmE